MPYLMVVGDGATFSTGFLDREDFAEYWCKQLRPCQCSACASRQDAGRAGDRSLLVQPATAAPILDAGFVIDAVVPLRVDIQALGDLHPATVAALQTLCRVDEIQPMEIHCYVDRTGGNEDFPFAWWGFVLFAADSRMRYGLIGYAGQRVELQSDCPRFAGADSGTVGSAEVSAQLWSYLCALSLEPKYAGLPMKLLYDSEYATAAVMARLNPSMHKDLICSASHAFDLVRITRGLVCVHIKSHTGDPFNELADSICVAAREGFFEQTQYVLPSGFRDKSFRGFGWQRLSVPSTVGSMQYQPQLRDECQVCHGCELPPSVIARAIDIPPVTTAKDPDRVNIHALKFLQWNVQFFKCPPQGNQLCGAAGSP